MNILQRFAKRVLIARLRALRHGKLTLRDGACTMPFGNDPRLAVFLDIHDPRFYTAVVAGGHLGAAEAYTQGWWSVSDLTALVQLFLRNRDVLDGLETGLARLAQPVRKLLHWFNSNSRRGSCRNIKAHYDLGNAFFAQFLDDTMTYSCGIFERPDASLEEAAIAKYDRICRKLDLQPTDHVLEIGTGWGGFAIHAAATYGCRITTTTISPAQFDEARRRVRGAGLADRITVLQRDYRDLRGQYDKVVSIEMIEAVGHEFLETFFTSCAALLADHGRMALQAITIMDRYYDSARREVDFIKRYIFPGSCIPSVSALGQAARTTDMRMVHLEDITPHYAETLLRWRQRFEANWPRIRAQGFPESTRRLWEFYFRYCEGGYREGVLGNAQIVFAKAPGAATFAMASRPQLQAVS
jgi:cyclopropane-fatty-acyl-phospholipid synthase